MKGVIINETITDHSPLLIIIFSIYFFVVIRVHAATGCREGALLAKNVSGCATLTSSTAKPSLAQS
jgi:hypothetical protein